MRVRHKKKHDEGGNEGAGMGRWLLTYADMITLLLALFIFLYSISKVDAQKLKNFTSNVRNLFGITSMSNNQGVPESMDIFPEFDPLSQVQDEIEEEFKEYIDSTLITIEASKEGLAIRFEDRVLFSLGQGEITNDAEPILRALAKSLQVLPNAIRVEGHTDDLPIREKSKYPSNWELSGARAASVLRFFIEQCGMDPTRLSLAGYGEYKPLVPNTPGSGNPKNRRVEIIVLR
jgi:chemotaxis protein MotB